jgi:alpha-glucosidase
LDSISAGESRVSLSVLPTSFTHSFIRWGYHNLSDARVQVESMRAANIPLEGDFDLAWLLTASQLTYSSPVMWLDIDLYTAYRDFTMDPVSFPPNEMKAFIEGLVSPLVARIRATH